MGEQVDLSVVISTYNRCGVLPAALESVLAQEGSDVCYEVIVVDNNSTDQTRQVVESFIARGHANVRYLFEGKQGLSHGWNTGITSSRAPIIALTDDDICVARDWVSNIKRAFDEHPEVDFVGSRVLPVWKHEPPSWLTRKHWAPLALQDCDTPFYSNAENQVCLLGKSFRREVFEQIGLFTPELGRVKDSIGSLEDHEMQRRLWRIGRRGLHVPSIVVTAEIQAERMTKAYHRRWHIGHGRFYAILRDEEFEQSYGRLFDVPAHMFRQAAVDIIAWLKHVGQGNHDEAFSDELQLRFFVGFFRQRCKDYLTVPGERSTMREIATLIRSLLTRKIHSNTAEKID